MGRVIKIGGAGKERKQLTRAIVLALRELMQQEEPDANTKDLAAFISSALETIFKSIDETVAPWEKRGYWIKADRYRMEWSWTEKLSTVMREALMQEDWPTVAMIAAKVGEKFNGVKIPQRNRIGTPWEGAWDKLRSRN